MPEIEVSDSQADMLTDLPLTADTLRMLENPLFQAVMKSQIVVPLPPNRFEIVIPAVIKEEKERIIAGYASVVLVDKQGDLIPKSALKKAWDKFIASPEFMNAQVMHSNIPVGKVIMEYKSPKTGEVWKSHVDDTGLFVIIKIRDDIKKGDETWMLIKQGDLKAFSIGGEALHRSIVCDNDKCFTRIDDLELHEISVVTKPANQGAYFAIVKCCGNVECKNQNRCWSCPNRVEDNDFVKLDDVMKLLPEGLILCKDFINLVGSTVEKGEGHDWDFQVRENLQSEFLNRAIRVRFSKLLGERGHVFLGDPQGPHDTYMPLYDLVLVKHDNPKPVTMVMGSRPVILKISDLLKKSSDTIQALTLLERLKELHEKVDAVGSSFLAQRKPKKAPQQSTSSWVSEQGGGTCLGGIRNKITEESPRKGGKQVIKPKEAEERMESGQQAIASGVTGSSAKSIKSLLDGMESNIGKMKQTVESPGFASRGNLYNRDKSWSDEAREASAEARAQEMGRGKPGRPPKGHFGVRTREPKSRAFEVEDVKQQSSGATSGLGSMRLVERKPKDWSDPNKHEKGHPYHESVEKDTGLSSPVEGQPSAQGQAGGDQHQVVDRSYKKPKKGIPAAPVTPGQAQIPIGPSGVMRSIKEKLDEVEKNLNTLKQEGGGPHGQVAEQYLERRHSLPKRREKEKDVPAVGGTSQFPTQA